MGEVYGATGWQGLGRNGGREVENGGGFEEGEAVSVNRGSGLNGHQGPMRERHRRIGSTIAKSQDSRPPHPQACYP